MVQTRSIIFSHTSTSVKETIKAIEFIRYILISAISIAFMELLIVRPFYNDYVATFSGMKIFFFVTGILSLIGNEIYLYYIVGKEIGYKFNFQEFKKKFYGK